MGELAVRKWAVEDSLLLLLWLTAQCGAFVSLMNLLNSSWSLIFCFQSLKPHFAKLIIITHLFIPRSASGKNLGDYYKILSYFLEFSILKMWPIHLNLLNLIKDTRSRSSYKAINSELYLILQISLTLIAPNILHSTCFWKMVSHFIISIFNCQS